MKLFTIGFTQKTAERFFQLLRDAGVKTLIDTRLNNRSQLAGFTKAEDLSFFLREIAGIRYEHNIEMAPTKTLLESYKKSGAAWELYDASYRDLIRGRRVVERLDPDHLRDACLLCSEHLPTHCHRRLLAEEIQRAFPQTEIVHLR